MKAFDFAQLERRIAALESASLASLRFGRVTEICEDKKGGKVRVQMKDGQGVVTHTISTLQKRVLKDKDIEMPDIGEPVACLFSGQGYEEGVLLGAYYSEREQDPKQPKTHVYRKFKDGTEMFFDREEHKFQMTFPAGTTFKIVVGPNELVMDDAGIRVKGPRIDLN